MTFYKWLHDAGLVGMPRREIDLMEEAWNAADKAAREECVELCKSIADKHKSSNGYDSYNLGTRRFTYGGVFASKQCSDAISASISDKSRQPEKRDES